jgi:hypothetical protein
LSLPVARDDDSRAVAAVRRIPGWVFGVVCLCIIAGVVIHTLLRNR